MPLSQRSFNLGLWSVSLTISAAKNADTHRRHSAQLRRVAPFLRFLGASPLLSIGDRMPPFMVEVGDIPLADLDDDGDGLGEGLNGGRSSRRDF